MVPQSHNLEAVSSAMELRRSCALFPLLLLLWVGFSSEARRRDFDPVHWLPFSHSHTHTTCWCFRHFGSESECINYHHVAVAYCILTCITGVLCGLYVPAFIEEPMPSEKSLHKATVHHQSSESVIGSNATSASIEPGSMTHTAGVRSHLCSGCTANLQQRPPLPTGAPSRRNSTVEAS